MQSTQQLILPEQAAAAIKRIAGSQFAKFVVTADATGAIPERSFFCAPAALTITSVYYLPTSASTPASGSNSQALLVQVYDGAGGAAASVAGKSIANATPTAAMQKFSLGTLTNATLAKGNVLSFKSTLTGTATVPMGELVVEYELA